ncbi:MAG: PIN domain-containing protein [Acidobacteriota bacterium]|nr:PIN domain-containing protein [Acidobacteriota bacterium]
MIAVDTNILVYAHRSDSDFFGAASAAIRKLAESSEQWAVPWPCIHEFLAVVTNPRIFKAPTPIGAAIQQVDTWLESPGLTLIGESRHYWRNLTEALTEGKIAGGKVHDARISAICRSHGVRELWTADRDFSRIPGVKTRNPLLAGKTRR